MTNREPYTRHPKDIVLLSLHIIISMTSIVCIFEVLTKRLHII